MGQQREVVILGGFTVISYTVNTFPSPPHPHTPVIPHLPTSILPTIFFLSADALTDDTNPNSANTAEDTEAGTSLLHPTRKSGSRSVPNQSEDEETSSGRDINESDPSKTQSEADKDQLGSDESSSLTNRATEPTARKSSDDSMNLSCPQKILRPFVTFIRGWKTYARQKVVFASLALAFLYMTVLGLDSVTTGRICFMHL